jgi:hypothetical protein
MHVIGMETEEGRGRFAKEYGDEEFYALPYIKEFGCPPPGFFALHFGEGESVENSERARRVAQLPLVVIGTPGHMVLADAEMLLRDYERLARAA